MGACQSLTGGGRAQKGEGPRRFGARHSWSKDDRGLTRREDSADSVSKNNKDALNNLHLLDLRQRETQVIKVSRWSWHDWLLGTKRGHLCILACAACVLLMGGALAWKAITQGEGFTDDAGDLMYGGDLLGSVWFAWGMFFDPGTQMGFPPSAPSYIKAVAVCFSMCGFLWCLLVLGLIVEMARTTLDGLRKRRARIVENGHTLLLGWSEKTLFMLKEIMCAAQDTKVTPKIVILADEDEVTMRSMIDRHFPKESDKIFNFSKVFKFRQGLPYECDELLKVSAASAREIFILGAPGHSRTSDLHLIRTVVALASLPDIPNGSIVGEVRNHETSQVIRTILETASGVFARDAINRVMCLMAVEPAVGHAFEDLLSFVSGNELYCKPLSSLHPSVANCRTFGEACKCFNNAVCIGLQSPGEHVKIAPKDSLELQKGDRLMLIASDSNDFEVRGIMDFASEMIFTNAQASEAKTPALNASGTVASLEIEDHTKAQTIVLVGWSNDVCDFVHALDFHLKVGSNIHILSEKTVEERQEAFEIDGRPHYKNITVHHHVGCPTNVKKLKELPLREASSIMVMSEDFAEFGNDACASDSSNLAIVITLNSLLGPHDPSGKKKRPKVICEILDAGSERMLLHNQELRKSAVFFHSNALETGLFAMASTEPAVFNCLLRMMQPNHAGSIAALPVEVFLPEQELGTRQLDWWDLWDRARQRDELLIGWHRALQDEPVINPHMSERLKIPPFNPGDQFIVLHCRGHPEARTSFTEADAIAIPEEPHCQAVVAT